MLAIDTLSSFDLSAAGGDTAVAAAGWASPETGHRWSLGARSVLCLPRPPLRLGCVLLLALAPGLRPQRLGIRVNGSDMGQFTLGRATRLGCLVPWSLIACRPTMEVELLQPDATRPCDIGPSPDDRALGFAVSRVGLVGLRQERAHPPSWPVPHAVPSIQAIAQDVESLGDNCEVGIVQRLIGVEPLGIFRWSGTAIPDLLEMFDAGFEGLDDPSQIELLPEAEPSLPPAADGALPRGPELFVRHRRYGLHYHTYATLGDADLSLLHRQESRRLALLRRKLFDDLGAGRKLYVCKRNEPLTEAEAIPLWLALQQRGPNTLMFVRPADPDHPPGSVHEVLPGLLRGHVDRLAEYRNATAVSIDCWIELLRNAHRLWTASRAVPAGSAPKLSLAAE